MYRKPTVMVVDDDPILRSLTTGILRNAEYDVVAECSSGEAALKQIPEIKPGLVLLDINLPDSDGITLIDMIQAVGNPVIVMMSGEATMDRVRAALGKGARGFVVKPFNAARLLGSLETALKDR
ncbi:MAG: response regulator [Neisseriaceae bacterium]|jgi:two-component system chemotaxis response regulator CheY|nr:two-component system, chemotaxis family, chemotaxis protein CheY [Pseudomonadota bacterium]RTL02029.1 MAG: response regulator [Neisseriaceae bacterium]